MPNLKLSAKVSSIVKVAITSLLLIGVCLYPLPAPATVDSQTQSPAAAAQKTTYDAYADIPAQDIQPGGGILEYAWNLSDPYYFYDKNPIVALVHIDSIAGGRNYDSVSQQYIYPQTVGLMTVQKVYKGQIKPGQQLNYARLGGIVTYEDYWNSLNQAQRDKIIDLNNGQRPVGKKYVQQKPFDDISIEVGRDYVVFITPQSAPGDVGQEYVMDGAQYGLRQAKQSGSQVMVQDNQTGQWEPLGSIVRLP